LLKGCRLRAERDEGYEQGSQRGGGEENGIKAIYSGFEGADKKKFSDDFNVSLCVTITKEIE
jgi:hypothetical protein